MKELLQFSTRFKTAEQIEHDEHIEFLVHRTADFCVCMGGHEISYDRICVHCGLSERDIAARKGTLKRMGRSP